MSYSEYHILLVKIARTRKSFKHPLLTSKHATQTTIPPNGHMAMLYSRNKMKW